MNSTHKVVFYGEDWALTEGVRGGMQFNWPEVTMMSVSDLAELEYVVWRYPRAGILLCLRPHVNVPVLDALRPLLKGRVVKVVSREVWFSDITAACALGYSEPVSTELLEAWLPDRLRLGRQGHPLESFIQDVVRSLGWKQWQVRLGKTLNEMSPERTRYLLKEIRGYTMTALPAGVTLQQWFILCHFANGMTGAGVAQVTGLKEKTLSLYRRHTLRMLGMDRVKCGMGLYRAIQVRESLQEYPRSAVFGRRWNRKAGRICADNEDKHLGAEL
ncbi:hypothetical protein V6973_004090 [Salmonella enterica]